MTPILLKYVNKCTMHILLRGCILTLTGLSHSCLISPLSTFQAAIPGRGLLRNKVFSAMLADTADLDIAAHF